MKKILIVDDEPLIRRVLSKSLSSRYLVVLAENGAEGLDKWLSEAPDLAILDVLMPGLTGPELIRSIHQTKSLGSCKIILMSAHQDNAEDAFQDLGIDLFIAKPFSDIFKIVEEIERLCPPMIQET